MAVARLKPARRTWGLLAVLGAFSMLAVHAPSAGALVVFDRAVHKSFSIVPALAPGGGLRTPASNSRAALQGMSCTTGCTALTYRGGVVQHGETIYLVFWAPSSYSPAFPASYVAGMGTWVNDLVGANGTPGNPISVNTQYYDHSGPGGSNSYVPYSITNGGTLTDTDAYPANGCPQGTTCLTDAQIRSELSAYITAHHLPTGLNTEYFVLTPQGVNSCFDSAGSSCSYTNFCGYHSSMTVSGAQVTFADMPWLYGVSGCDVNSAFGTGYPNSNFVDPVVGVFSHELSETMTDPVVGQGWTDGIGNEIGDKCAYMYGSGGKGAMTGMNKTGTAYWNVKLGSDVYLLQQEFDNQAANCTSRMIESWSGTTANGAGAAHWSNAANWGANIAPGAGSSSSDVVHTLSFPALGAAGCSAQPPTATCYTSSNDLTYLTAYGLSVDGGSGYAIGGNALTLGAGGVTSTTSASSANPSSFSAPLTLGANQTWSIDGGAHKVGQLTLAGTVTGSSRTVNVNLSNAGSLVLGGDDEAGNVAIAGSNGANTGTNAPLNGSVTVNTGLDGTDGNSVSLTDGALLAPGTPSVGGLTSVGGDLEVGKGTVPAGSMTVQGGVALDAASQLKLFIDHSGPAGVDSSELIVHGPVTLGGSLVLSGGMSCPSLTLGDQYTLITTTGSLSGTFSGVPNGQDVQLSCSGAQLQLQIHYTANSVTATVVTGAAGGSGGGGSGTLTPGTPSVSGSIVTVPLSCAGGAGAQCVVTITLTVTATTKSGRLIAVTAAAHRRHGRKSTRVLVVGSGTVTLTAGQSQLLQIVLNAAGQHLIALRHVLVAKLSVVQSGQTVSNLTVTFHSKSGRKHRHRR